MPSAQLDVVGTTELNGDVTINSNLEVFGDVGIGTNVIGTNDAGDLQVNEVSVISSNGEWVGAAITTPQLADAAVSTAKLGNEQITEAKLQDGAVTPEKISGGTIIPTGGIILAQSPDDTGLQSLGYSQVGAIKLDILNSWSPIATATGAPSVRQGAAAVWTGEKLIVWGGSKSSERMNDGAAYDLSANVWSPINPIGAPSGRGEAHALWTGTEMIIFGGSVGGGGHGGWSKEGGRYAPQSDDWSAIPQFMGIMADHGYTTVWAGDRMIVWGGTSHPSTLVNSGASYFPASNSWQQIADNGAPTPRRLHTAVWTGTQMIIWGGYPALNTGGVYTPDTDQWTETATDAAPEARYWHSAVWTGEKMIVWGGRGDAHQGLYSGGAYDPASDTWAPISDLNAPAGSQGSHRFVWTGQKAIAWLDGDSSRSGGIYDPDNDSWRGITNPALGGGSYSTSAAWTGDLLLVWSQETRSGGLYDYRADVRDYYLYMKQ